MKPQFHTCHSRLLTGATIGLISAGLLPLTVRAQFTPAQIAQFKNVIGDRVEAVTILGGDVGITGATFNSTDKSSKDVTMNISKFGGAGDIGDPKPLGNTGIGWQPRLQGSMGYLTAKNDLNTGLLNGDTSEYDTFAIQFGGGARFWFNNNFSVAPTFMGMYGHTKNSYTANSAFGRANFAAAENVGLINWSADTWTVRPALDLQYVFTWRRTIFTLSSDPTYFHTESFSTSTPNLSINGNSESWENKIDVDVPTGKMLFGHELRTGGYFARTEFFDDLKTGLNTDHLYEAHGRVVLDFLGELWKVQWIGIGASYLWGNSFTGYSFGADVAFRF